MLVKKLRHGTVFGFYSKENTSQYNCYFKDHNALISYDPDKPFEYNDITRYGAALFTNHCCDEFFRDLQLKNLDGDVEGFHHSLLINGIHVRARYLDIFMRSFPGFQWDVKPLVPGYCRLKISTNGSLRRLLSFASLFSLINAIQNGECNQHDDGLLVKYAKLIQYLDAPYFVRYIFKANLIRRQATFGKVQPCLETEKIKLQPGNNFLQRMRFVEKNITGSVIVDVGCGEGKYLRYAKKVDHYYAVERDPERQNQARRKIEKDNLENVTLLDSVEQLPDTLARKTVILTEVVEHNAYDDAIALLKSCLLPDSRVIVTTPNRDFNVHYSDQWEPDVDSEGQDETGFRHEDHKFELSGEEFQKFIDMATAGVDCRVTFVAIGDTVDGVSPQSAAVIETYCGGEKN